MIFPLPFVSKVSKISRIGIIKTVGFAGLALIWTGCAGWPYLSPPPQQPVVVVLRETAPCPDQGIAYLRVKSAPPFAVLQINGQNKGETPTDQYMQIPAGRVSLEVIHRLFPPRDTILELRPGEHRDIKITLADPSEADVNLQSSLRPETSQPSSVSPKKKVKTDEWGIELDP